MATSLHLLRAAAAAPWLGLVLSSAPALAQPAPEPPPAAAQPQPPEAPPAPAAPADQEPAWQREPAVRRSGFTAGIAGGLALGSVAGYPNDVKKIGRARYYTETGVGLGTGGFLWIGASLADYLTFGIAFGGLNLGPADASVSSAQIMFHVEAFPLFPLGGAFRELGVMIDTGTGSVIATPDAGGDALVDGGAVSRIGGGVFYEGLRAWKISTGPWLYGDYTWSSTVRKPGAFLGWRTVVYTGP